MHAVLCAIVFILFHDRDGQGGVIEVTKNDHLLVFLVVWVLLPRFLGR